ncbi:MAG: hypothetical protein J6U01_06550 [Clostridia bacterium]|nr:hypothetical protein [Clostridia bacterium]
MLKLLLKNRILALADQFSGQKKGKRALDVRRIAVLAGAAVLILAVGGFLLSGILGPLYTNMAESGMEWLYFAMTGGVAFLVSFMFTSIYAQGAIFEAKDNEMLLAMPISPAAILGSRIASLYFLNFLFDAAFMATAGIVKLVQGGTADAAGVIQYVICIFLLTLFSTTLSCLLGWLVSMITRRIRRKAMFQLFISLALLGGFYAIILGDLNRHIQTITENSESIAGVFRGVLYPFYAMGAACTGKDFGMFLIFAACCILPFGLVCFVMNKSFVRIVTSRSALKKIRYEAGKLKSSSAIWALTKKELTCFFNSSSYMLNTGLGLLISVGLTIMIAVNVNNSAAGKAAETAEAVQSEPGFLERIGSMIGPDGLMLMLGLILAVFAAFVYISGPSISVEGNNIWILKSSPLRASEILKSKVYAHLTVAVPISLVSSLILVITVPGMHLLAVVYAFLMPLLAHIFCAQIGVIANLYFGRLNYPSMAKAVKSNSAALIPLLSTGAVTLLPFILYFSVLKDTGISFRMITIISLGLMAVLNTGMFAFLHSAAAQKRWNAIGQ